MRPAVLLDRDGTLLEEAGYLSSLDRLVFFPYAVDAVRLLNRARLAVVVVTNQAGIARGFFDESFVAATHAHISERLTAAGAWIDGFYYCPHHPDGCVEAYRRSCDCRKPQPGLLRRAATDLGIDLTQSFVVGDRWRDLEAAGAVGAQGILVRTGYGRDEEATSTGRVRAAVIADNLIGAVSWILQTR